MHIFKEVTQREGDVEVFFKVMARDREVPQPRRIPLPVEDSNPLAIQSWMRDEMVIYGSDISLGRLK